MLEADAPIYASLGVRHVKTFAVWIDAEYVKRAGEPGAIQDYRETLRQQPVAQGDTVAPLLLN